jgi:hypothetical protein
MLCWHWEREGKEILFLIIEMDSNRVILRQEYPPPGENSNQIVQPIWLSFSSCNYGGTRAWFCCPGRPCGRKVAILYKAGDYFVCRTCYGLRYMSQRTSLRNRRLQERKRVRKKRLVERRSFSGHYEYVEILPKRGAVPKSREKLNEAPVRKILISLDPPNDSTSQPLSRRKPKADSPAANRAETEPRAADASPEKLRSERPELSVVERYREFKRRTPVHSTRSAEPVGGTERVETPGHLAPSAKRTEPTPNGPNPTLNWNDVSSEKFKRENEPRPNPLLQRDRKERRALPVCAWCGEPFETTPLEFRGFEFHSECWKHRLGLLSSRH